MDTKIPEDVDINTLTCKVDNSYSPADCIAKWKEKDLFGNIVYRNLLTIGNALNILENTVLFSTLYSSNGFMKVTYNFKENVRCKEEYKEHLQENYITCKINKNK